MRGRPRTVRISIDKAQLGVLTGQWGAVVTLQRRCLMHRRIILKLGVSIVVGVAVILFYLVNAPDDRSRSGGRAYRKLVLESSPELLSTRLSEELSRKSAKEDLNKHVEAVRIHTQISARSARHAHESNGVLDPPGLSKVKDGLFEDKLSHAAEKLKKEPIHLLGGFPQEGGEEIKNVSSSKKSSKDDQLSQSRKVDQSVLSHPGKEHDFRFESEHLDANIKKLRNSAGQSSPPIHLCVVVCGTRSEETITMLKSAIMVTALNVSLVFHIFAEPEIQKFFQNQLDLWPLVQRQRLSYHIYNVTFPDSSTTNAWKKLFKPCASQRLFLPNLLRSVQRLIYVDTDTVFLESLAHLWALFDDFNSTQLAGLVGEAEAGFAAWYNRFANHPFYGKYGLNSGVMLMDLDRLRQTSWLSDMQRLFNQYRLSLPWGDQDLINIYFAFHPDQMYLMPCRWNYRNDHCRYNSNCFSAEKQGIAVLHGSRRTFESNKEPLLKIIHKAFTKYEFGDDMEFKFLKNLEEDIKSEKPKLSNCWKVSSNFTFQLQFLRDRNEEFMQASRKANPKLGSTRRHSRTGIALREKPGHFVQGEDKLQDVGQRKKKTVVYEAQREGDNHPQLPKEKPTGAKEKAKKEPLLAQTGQREHKERLDKSLLTPREEKKNAVRPEERKKQTDRKKQDLGHQIVLQEDTLDNPRPIATLVKHIKSPSQQREAEKSYVRGRSVVETMFVGDKEPPARDLDPRSGKLRSPPNVHGGSKIIQVRNQESENLLKKSALKFERRIEDRAVNVESRDEGREQKH